MGEPAEISPDAASPAASSWFICAGLAVAYVGSLYAPGLLLSAAGRVRRLLLSQRPALREAEAEDAAPAPLLPRLESRDDPAVIRRRMAGVAAATALSWVPVAALAAALPVRVDPRRESREQRA